MRDTAAPTAPAPYDGLDAMPIAGRWRAGTAGDTLTDTNPWTGETLLEIPMAGEDDLNEAFDAAVVAQREWAKRPPGERAAVMREAARIIEARQAEIGDWITREIGGTQAKAELECGLAQGQLLEAAGMASRVQGAILPSEIPGKENRVYKRPVGVVSVISPWNFPLQLSVRSVAPALAVGNAVVLKPASDSPLTGALLLAKVLDEAGLPPGLLSVLIGRGSEIGDAIVQHPAAAVVSFTGSSPVGKGIAEQAQLKQLALELGGNGPLVVLADADLGRAVDAAIFGSFFHQGQICMRLNRIIVEAPLHDAFVDAFVERARALQTGDPSDPETQLGPVINERQRDDILDKVRRAQNDGAELVLGGEPQGPTGLGLPPHVLLGGNDVATAREEVFGPVATIIEARDEARALELANDTEYGLSSAVFTADAERGVRFALRVEAGMTHVNDSSVNDDPNTAFGGEKASGIGRFGGEWAIDEFTTDHWVSVQHEPREYPI